MYVSHTQASGHPRSRGGEVEAALDPGAGAWTHWFQVLAQLKLPQVLFHRWPLLFVREVPVARSAGGRKAGSRTGTGSTGTSGSTTASQQHTLSRNLNRRRDEPGFQTTVGDIVTMLPVS